MDDIHTFEKAASLLEAGQSIAIVTVIAATGSTPGRVGYKMLVFGAGPETVGTVGGGLVEGKMIAQAAALLSSPASQVFQFELGETPEDEKGICGGTVEFLVEAFDREALPLFQDLAAAVRQEEPGVLLSIMAPDGLPRKMLLEDISNSAVAESDLAPEVVAALVRLTAAGQGAEKISTDQFDVFIEHLAQPPTAVIFGAGHLSYYIARMAKEVHFKIVVYDDREEFANRDRFPDADEIVVADFEHVLEHVRIGAHSYVVIVTRGHRCDQVVLEQVFGTEARYIGMIGSKHKTRTILDKLTHKGFSQEALARVYSPIGLALGAVTPEEISLSIVSELVKVRRLDRTPSAGHMTLTGSGGYA